MTKLNSNEMRKVEGGNWLRGYRCNECGAVYSKDYKTFTGWLLGGLIKCPWCPGKMYS